MKKIGNIPALILFLLVLGLSACKPAPAAAPAALSAELPAVAEAAVAESPAVVADVSSESVSVVFAQIIPDDAVQSLPDAEILGYVYQDLTGGVTSTSGLDIPSGWDGIKPPQPMYVGDKTDGATMLFCELDVELTTNEQTVYRCGYPGKG